MVVSFNYSRNISLIEISWTFLLSIRRITHQTMHSNNRRVIWHTGWKKVRFQWNVTKLSATNEISRKTSFNYAMKCQSQTCKSSKTIKRKMWRMIQKCQSIFNLCDPRNFKQKCNRNLCRIKMSLNKGKMIMIDDPLVFNRREYGLALISLVL